MKRETQRLSLGICVWLVPLCCSLSQVLPPPEREKKAINDRLCVSIWPKKTRVETGEYFEVSLRVVNATDKLQTFRVFAGSWTEHWKTKNDRMTSIGFPAITNPTMMVKLEPGEAYEKTLQMAVKESPLLVTTSFQMGFTPLDEKKTYWSNRVVLGIKPGKPKDSVQPSKRY